MGKWNFFEGTKVKFWVNGRTVTILVNWKHKKTCFELCRIEKQTNLLQGNSYTPWKVFIDISKVLQYIRISLTRSRQDLNFKF